MKITIGDHEFATRKPVDLDKALEHTGLSAAETAAALKAGGQPAHVARALLPFLPEEDRPLVHDLAALMDPEPDAMIALRADVLKLYEPEQKKA